MEDTGQTLLKKHIYNVRCKICRKAACILVILLIQNVVVRANVFVKLFAVSYKLLFV